MNTITDIKERTARGPALKVNDEVPVDIEHLNLFTDGDPDEEKELLDLFFEQASLSVVELDAALGKEDHEAWEKVAHRLKGSAANLGAHILSGACAEAEAEFQTDHASKTMFLISIKASLNDVQRFFEGR